jgi:zinc transport system substrate-binding protein
MKLFTIQGGLFIKNWHLIAVSVIFMLQACHHSRQKQSENIISVSIQPIGYFVDRLTVNTLEVNVMVPSGASHGSYSPSPRQFRKLSDSDLYLRIGFLGYEQAWIGKLQEMNPNMKVVNLSDYVNLIRGMEIDHGNHKHEGGIDPHIWMSPLIMKELLPLIKTSLIDVYPDLKEVIENNYPKVQFEVEALHDEYAALSKTLSNKTFMIYHPALTYLARDYGFTQVSIEHEGKEPSPAMMGRIIRDAREHSVSVIFIQEEYDMRSAELISKETGAKLLQINPLSYDWMESMKGLKHLLSEHLK